MFDMSISGRSALLAGVAAFGLAATTSMAENAGGWEFSVAPLYLWGKNINGAASIGPLEAPLDLDFKDDILENLDAAFAIHFEAKQGDLTLFAEYNYAKLDPSAEESIGPITVTGQVDFEDTMAEFGVAYAFWNSDRTSWEVLGGARYMEQEIDVKLAGLPEVGPLPPGVKVSGGDDWWHGFGGFRVITKLSQNWSFRARGDYGYRDGDNKALHGIALFDYRFRGWGSVFGGYRYLDTEYDNGRNSNAGYAFDADQQGPLIGLSFYF